MCQCLPSPKNMFKKVPDLAAKAIWFMTNYDIQNGIWINVRNIYLLCKCCLFAYNKVIKSHWQCPKCMTKNTDCPFPFIISNVYVKRCMNFRYNSYIPHVRVSTFFYLMNWKGFVQLMRNLWQVEQVVACLNLALPAEYSASIFFWWQFDMG